MDFVNYLTINFIEQKADSSRGFNLPVNKSPLGEGCWGIDYCLSLY